MAPLHGNQFLKLDPEQKPSPLGDRFPPRRGKMSRSDKRGSRWRVAPDEGYLRQNAVVLRPHQSPTVTFLPGRGESVPARGKSFLKGGASGGTAYFAWIAKASHFGRGGIAQAMTERARLPTFRNLKFPKYAIYACKVLFLRCKYCILVSFTAGFACQNTSQRESIAFQSNQERGIL